MTRPINPSIKNASQELNYTLTPAPISFNFKIQHPPKTESFLSPSKALNISLSPRQISNVTVQSDAKASLTFNEKFRHFFSDLNVAPPYGYQDNAVTGVGFWLMQGARIAISVYDSANNSASFLDSTIKKMIAVFIGFATLPFTIVGVLMKEIGSHFPYRVEGLTSDMIAQTPAHKVDQIYDLLQIVDTVMRELKIDYSMDGGTLLGAVRDGGVIRWDDDGDIFLDIKDKERFQTLVAPRLRDLGIVVHSGGSFDALKLNFNDDTLKMRYGVDAGEAAGVDIFFTEEGSDGIVRPKSAFFQHQFPNEYFLREELQNLKDYPFGPPEKRLFLKGPSEPMRYLKTYYGPECMDYALRSHSHINLGVLSLPLLNFSQTRYKIVNPTYAVGNSTAPVKV